MEQRQNNDSGRTMSRFCVFCRLFLSKPFLCASFSCRSSCTEFEPKQTMPDAPPDLKVNEAATAWCCLGALDAFAVSSCVTLQADTL